MCFHSIIDLLKNIKILSEQVMELELQNYHEINQYRDILFPVELYQVSETGINPFGRGLRDFHWQSGVR